MAEAGGTPALPGKAFEHALSLFSLFEQWWTL
jgi:hypothetical protein